MTLVGACGDCCETAFSISPSTVPYQVADVAQAGAGRHSREGSTCGGLSVSLTCVHRSCAPLHVRIDRLLSTRIDMPLLCRRLFPCLMSSDFSFERTDDWRAETNRLTSLLRILPLRMTVVSYVLSNGTAPCACRTNSLSVLSHPQMDLATGSLDRW